MNLEPTNADYQELLKDERANRLLANIILQRLLKEELAKNDKLTAELAEYKEDLENAQLQERSNSNAS